MCDDYPEIVGTDTLKRCWVLLRSSTTSEDLGNVCRLLDADLRPLTPDYTCERSREIFEEHKQIAQEYLKVQTEIALLSQHKNEMLKNLSLDSLKQQQELRKLEDEKESLVKLCRNLTRQLQIMKDQRINGALTNASAPTIVPAVPGNNGWVVVPRQDPSRLSWDATYGIQKSQREYTYVTSYDGRPAMRNVDAE